MTKPNPSLVDRLKREINILPNDGEMSRFVDIGFLPLPPYKCGDEKTARNLRHKIAFAMAKVVTREGKKI